MLLDSLQLARSLFEAQIADTFEQGFAARRLRFKVYCQEAGFFDPANYADQLEVDPYDTRSLQSLAVLRPTGTAVGTVRLILPSRDPGSPYQKPFDAVCDPSSLEEQKLLLDAEATAELSRFCVTRDLVGQLRQLIDEGRIPAAEPAEVASCAKIWLMRGIVEMSAREHITHWCAVMEPRLLRSLARLGIRFTPIGPPVRYYGERQPCWGQVESLLHAVREEAPEVWRIVTDDGRLCR